MRIEGYVLTFSGIFFVAGCGDSASGGLPLGGSKPPVSPADTGESTTCGEVWILDDDGVVNDPTTCMAWSPRSAFTMTWFEAASQDEGAEGNCGSHCPEEESAYCASLGVLGGRNDWRLPSKRELLDAAKTYPEIPDVSGRLWSLDTNSGSPDSAWTVDLDRAGASLALDKDDAGVWVRCVSEG